MGRWSVFCLVVSSLAIGCQQPNNSEFQSFDEKRQAGYVPPESFPTDVELTESEPLTAELEPESNDLDIALDFPVSALAPLNLVDGSNVAAMFRVAELTERPSGPGGTAPPPSTGPRKVELLVKDREFRPEGPNGALRVGYDDLDLLKILNMEPVTADATAFFPAWLKGLDSQRIRIRGYMMPTFESSGLERFVLARDTGLCCFGRNPKVYDLISVELKPDKPSDYIHLRPFDVIGTLKIDLVVEAGRPIGLYWIEDAEVVQK